MNGLVVFLVCCVGIYVIIVASSIVAMKNVKFLLLPIPITITIIKQSKQTKLMIREMNKFINMLYISLQGSEGKSI